MTQQTTKITANYDMVLLCGDGLNLLKPRKKHYKQLIVDLNTFGCNFSSLVESKWVLLSNIIFNILNKKSSTMQLYLRSQTIRYFYHCTSYGYFTLDLWVRNLYNSSSFIITMQVLRARKMIVSCPLGYIIARAQTMT